MRFPKLRFRRRVPDKTVPPLPEDMPDIAAEQQLPEYTTLECPDAATDLSEVKKHPQEYIEINIIRKTRIVDTFAVPITLKNVRYKEIKKQPSDKKPGKKRYFEYHINEKYVYLLPTRHGYLMPTAFYYEGKREPVRFLNTNRGITGKALALLYKEQLYVDLFSSDDDQYNLFIVILSIVLIGLYSAGLYLLFFYNGGVI